jgi:hypothetical protein
MPLNVPLTGSMVPGPLGLVHLPRMWQKAMLTKIGVLPDDYLFGRGFDQRIADGVGIDCNAFMPFLETMPSYLETESWVRSHATKLDAVGATSESIVNHVISPQFGDKLRAGVGIADASFDNGARLNNIDDWVSLQQYVLAHRGGPAEVIVPAISSLASGPLGLLHLPRLWGKAIIKAGATLPEGFHSGSGPLDVQLAEAIGMDLAASVRYVNAELPPYLVYEQWVRDNATTLDAGTLTAWNERMRTRAKPPAMAAEERAMLGLADETLGGSAILNDLIDWHLWHEEVVGRAAAPST